MPKLKPPKNFRAVKLRCCGTCAYSQYDNTLLFCRRTSGPIADASDGSQWQQVCDGWRSDQDETVSYITIQEPNR